MCLAWVRHRRWHAYQIYVKIFCITKFHRATAVSHAMLKHILKTAIHVRNSETILSALYIETSMQSTNTNTRYTRAHVADSDFQMKSLDLFDIKLKYKICFHGNHLAFVIAECVVLCAPLSVLVWLVQQRFFYLISISRTTGLSFIAMRQFQLLAALHLDHQPTSKDMI